jgi:hypothetical protein
MYHDVSTFFSYPLACFATNNNQYIGGAGAGVFQPTYQAVGGPTHFFWFAISQQSSHWLMV